MGTGSVCHSERFDVLYILTSAHNVITGSASDPDVKPIYHTNMNAYRMRKGEKKYTNKYELSKCVVHPKYDGHPWCGFDIAICIVGKHLGQRNYTDRYYADESGYLDSFPHQIKAKKLKEGMKV